MILKASPETIRVGAYVLKEGVMVVRYIAYVGVITRVVGQRVYHQMTRYRNGAVDFVEDERWSHFKSMRFVADSHAEAERFRDLHNNSLKEVERRVNELRDVLTAEHAAMISAELERSHNATSHRPMVGCETEEGLPVIHAESESCAVCKPSHATDAGVAAIHYALKLGVEGIDFLRCWNEGGFDAIRAEWPDAPESVYIGADPAHPKTKVMQ